MEPGPIHVDVILISLPVRQHKMHHRKVEDYDWRCLTRLWRRLARYSLVDTTQHINICDARSTPSSFARLVLVAWMILTPPPGFWAIAPHL